MGRTIPDLDVTGAELAVLQALWDLETATIRQLTDRVYPHGGASAYATVQKLLERLEDKECVQRDRSAMAHVFRAAVSRDAVIGKHLRDVAEKLCGGSFTPLLTNLLQADAIGPVDRAELRRLLSG